jgi:N-acyl-D-amino-acid deacylase
MKKLLILSITLLVTSSSFAQKVDYLIKNGYVFDGTGADSVKKDIGISGDRIVFLGNSAIANIQADKVIDVAGKYVSPGFIDPHTHIERLLNSDNKLQRAALIWLRQGVTTVLTGNDGYGKANVGEVYKNWETNGVGPNVATFVGLADVRTTVLGDKPVQPNAKQLVAMQTLVDKAMNDGAIGLSTGLSYLPQAFAKTPEIVALAKIAAKHGGVYDTHMRAQGWPSSKTAIEEVLQIEKESGIQVHISHIKSSGMASWGKSANIIKLLNEARKKGSTIDADVYPYTASANGLRNIIPVWAREDGTEAMLKHFDDANSLAKITEAIAKNLKSSGGGVGKLLSTRSKSLAYLNGKTIADMAKTWEISEEEAVIKVLRVNPTITAISFGMDEGDIINFLKQPYITVGSDGSDTHPRGAGSFAKVISEYALQQKIVPLKEMIYKCTGLTAKTFKLKDRGVIREGAFADIVIFDPETYKANASYQQPAAMATGVKAVFVNGQKVIEDDKHSGVLAGSVIRFNQQ